LLIKEGGGLINFFESFDTRFQAYYILDEIENLLISGIFSSTWSSEGGPAEFLEDSINLAKGVMKEIVDSVDQNSTENLLALNFKFIYLMIVSLYVLNDVPELRSSRLGTLFMVNPNFSRFLDTKNILIQLARMHSTLGISLIYLDKLQKIKLDNNSVTREKPRGFSRTKDLDKIDLSTGFIATTLNDTGNTLQQAFGYHYQKDLLDNLSHSQSGMFDEFKSDEFILNQIVTNTHWLIDEETNLENNNIEEEPSFYSQDSANNEIYEYEIGTNQYNENYQSDQYQSIQSNNNYVGIDLLKQKLQSFGINYSISNKAYQKNSMSVLENQKTVNKILNVFEKISNCGGNLEAFVSNFRNHGGLNLEFIRNGQNCFMSARLNRRDRLCLNQGCDGIINILSFGTHYNNLDI